MAQQPRIYRVKNGWAAAGKGWAVHGETQEEAMRGRMTVRCLNCYRDVEEIGFDTAALPDQMQETAEQGREALLRHRADYRAAPHWRATGVSLPK